MIEALVVNHLGLNEIEDLVDFMIPSDEDEAQNLPFHALVSTLAPLVFEASLSGDEVARNILIEMGRELGLCVRLVACKLFGRDDSFPLVFGGSVLTKGRDPVFARTIEQEARKDFPNLYVKVLDSPPVLGGVLLAMDLLAEKGVLEKNLASRRHDPLFRETLGRALLNARVETIYQEATTQKGLCP